MVKMTSPAARPAPRLPHTLHERRLPAARLTALAAALIAGLASMTATGSTAALAQTATTGPSGLPLPRFVSIKSERVNMRIGPGRDYKVAWMFVQSGLPIEIIQEFDNWRKVRDWEGEEGWILQSLLSGKRTAIAAPWREGEADGFVKLHARADEAAAISARLEPNVVVDIEKCDGQWCEVTASGRKGHLRQTELWGVYPGEIVD